MPTYRLICDACGSNTRKPAIDIGLGVVCPRCAPKYGMFPGEHGETRSYEEWKRLAAGYQDAVGLSCV